MVAAIGLYNSQATFETFMSSIFCDIIDAFVVIYLDDLLVFSETAEDDTRYMEQILNQLNRDKLSTSPNKCDLVQKYVRFLEISARQNKICVGPSKNRSYTNMAGLKIISRFSWFY